MKSILRHSAQLIAGLAIATALSSCGGGGDSAAVANQIESFVRIDRMGQPALGTALLSPSTAISAFDAAGNLLNPGSANPINNFNDQRDQFNRGDPVTDGQFVTTLLFGAQPNSLRNIHFETGPFLRALGLTLCSTENPPNAAPDQTQVNIDACVTQVQTAPVVPDVLAFNFAVAAGWPNGRHYDDPVVDRLLAAALLNLATPGQTIHSLVGVINRWNGPTGVGCVAPCPFTGDDSGVISPVVFPFLRPANP